MFRGNAGTLFRPSPVEKKFDSPVSERHLQCIWCVLVQRCKDSCAPPLFGCNIRQESAVTVAGVVAGASVTALALPVKRRYLCPRMPPALLCRCRAGCHGAFVVRRVGRPVRRIASPVLSDPRAGRAVCDCVRRLDAVGLAAAACSWLLPPPVFFRWSSLIPLPPSFSPVK